MSARYMYLVRMDVAHDLEATFNEVYDTEHVPLLLVFAGVLGGLLAFGIIGLFVGPVVLAVSYTLHGAWVGDGPSASQE